MKCRKIFLTVMTILMLCGCSSNTANESKANGASETQSVKELYKGLDAKNTYKKACEYFDEEVSYFKQITVDTPKGGEEANPGINHAEIYKENGKVNGVLKWISKYMSLFTIYSNGKYYEQNYEKSIEYTVEEQAKKYNERQGQLITPLLESSKSEGSEVDFVDVTRSDNSGDIVISVKYKSRVARVYADGKKEWKEDKYKIKETYIGKDGFIYKVVGKECDANFLNSYVVYTNQITDINKKKTFNYEEEIMNLKKYENMKLEDFRKELGV